jgi:hypothetical protein
MSVEAFLGFIASIIKGLLVFSVVWFIIILLVIIAFGLIPIRGRWARALKGKGRSDRR